jgi:hypothetical protein
VDKAIRAIRSWLLKRINDAAPVPVAIAVLVLVIIGIGAGVGANIVRQHCTAGKACVAVLDLSAESRCYKDQDSVPGEPNRLVLRETLSVPEAEALAVRISNKLSQNLAGLRVQCDQPSNPTPPLSAATLAEAVHRRLEPDLSALEARIVSSIESANTFLITAAAAPTGTGPRKPDAKSPAAAPGK